MSDWSSPSPQSAHSQARPYAISLNNNHTIRCNLYYLFFSYQRPIYCYNKLMLFHMNQPAPIHIARVFIPSPLPKL